MSSVVSVRSKGLNQPLTGQARRSFKRPSLRRRDLRLSRYSPLSIRSISNSCPGLMRSWWRISAGRTICPLLETVVVTDVRYRLTYRPSSRLPFPKGRRLKRISDFRTINHQALPDQRIKEHRAACRVLQSLQQGQPVQPGQQLQRSAWIQHQSEHRPDYRFRQSRRLRAHQFHKQQSSINSVRAEAQFLIESIEAMRESPVLLKGVGRTQCI